MGQHPTPGPLVEAAGTQSHCSSFFKLHYFFFCPHFSEILEQEAAPKLIFQKLIVLINVENSIRQPDLNPHPDHQGNRNCGTLSKIMRQKLVSSFIILLDLGFISQNFQNKKLKCQIRNLKLY